MDVMIGLLILGAILLGAWVVTHHKAPEIPAARDLASTIAASATDAWEAVKRDLPEIVSAEVAQLKADVVSWQARALKAEQDLAAEVQASQTRLAAVQAEVGKVIAGIGSQPASALVASTQAADAARVTAYASSISPAQPAHT